MNLPDPRHPQVVRLLFAWYVATLPAPRAPRWERDAAAGFTEGVWRTCPRCNGDRQITWKRTTVACDHPHCKAAGGWWTDPYENTGRPIEIEADRPETSVLDFTLEILQLDVKELDRIDQALEPDPDRTAGGTPACLLHVEHALNTMRHTAPFHRAVLVCHEILRIPTHADTLDEAYDRLADNMPPGYTTAPHWMLAAALDRIATQAARRSTSRWATDAERQERDQLIRRYHERGWTARAIARHLGIGKTTVNRVLAAPPATITTGPEPSHGPPSQEPVRPQTVEAA